VPDALTPDASPDDQPRFLLDLGVVTRHQLRQCGVPGSQIWSVCASSSDDEFFSDRHARPCGRFAVVARRANYDYGVGTEA
jgi:copper oxidase (laccase) domain-containing protein